MLKLLYKDITVDIFCDPMEYAKSEYMPFGEIPEGAQFAGIYNTETGKIDGSKSTGFAILADKYMVLYVDPTCPFADLLSTVAHELGHLIEGGYKKNPPNTHRYATKHEAKAEHYEHFALDAYHLTQMVLTHVQNDAICQLSLDNMK